MKIKHCFFALTLATALVPPVSAMCLGNLLFDYSRNPQGVTSPGAVLNNSQLALVKVVAVRTDRIPRSLWIETGTVELRKIEGTGKHLPVTFSVPYEKRNAGYDCETFDYFVPKPGERLLAFVRPNGKGWVIPELAASGIVSDVQQLPPALRAKLQPFFRTRL